MTIDEAIQLYTQRAENHEYILHSGEFIGGEGEHMKQDIKRCVSEHRQLAEWLRQLKDLVADVQSVNQWISVEDKLPIEHGPVLCYARSTTGEGNCRILGTLRNGEFWFLQVDGTQLSFPCLNLKVTHWMPLPDPPVDGGNEDENT